MMDTALFDKALLFALEAHKGQSRKWTNVPYILHPMETATIVSTMTDDQEVIVAALLHDTVEDTPITIEEIEKEFGIRVKELVESETESKRQDLPSSETWKKRKEESLELLKNTSNINVKMLWLSDKLSNLRSFYRLYKEHGDGFWNRFNQKDPKEQGWYYKTIEQFLLELEGTAALQEYSELVNMLFGDLD